MKPFRYRFDRMPTDCGGIVIGGKYDCINPIQAGVEQRLLLINKADWDVNAVVVYDLEIPTLITSITLINLAVAYVFDGTRKSINPQTAYTPSTFTVGYDHQVEFLIFDISSAQKYNIEEMALSKGIVAIVQNKNTEGNDDSIFEVFGKDVGLEIQPGAMRISGDVETNGAYTINLKTSDEMGKEQHLPASVWDSDFVTTLEMINALLIPTP